jgi:hypothetical protein
MNIPGTRLAGPEVRAAIERTYQRKVDIAAWNKASTGKFLPIEPATGFDHKERCSGMRPATRDRIRERNHETAVAAFLGGDTPPRSTPSVGGGTHQ